MEELEKRVKEIGEIQDQLLEELGYDVDYIPEAVKLINLKKPKLKKEGD